MRIEPVEGLKSFRLYDAVNLDPIFVVMHDMGAGCGRVVMECYGDVWSGYWGAMGDRTIKQFLLDCSSDYIANKMFGREHKRNKRSEAYLLRIVTAVQAALKSEQHQRVWTGPGHLEETGYIDPPAQGKGE